MITGEGVGGRGRGEVLRSLSIPVLWRKSLGEEARSRPKTASPSRPARRTRVAAGQALGAHATVKAVGACKRMVRGRCCRAGRRRHRRRLNRRQLVEARTKAAGKRQGRLHERVAAQLLRERRDAAAELEVPPLGGDASFPVEGRRGCRPADEAGHPAVRVRPRVVRCRFRAAAGEILEEAGRYSRQRHSVACGGRGRSWSLRRCRRRVHSAGVFPYGVLFFPLQSRSSSSVFFLDLDL